MSLGTLGMKNERILRVLLDMFELDTCEYVRLMVSRLQSYEIITKKSLLLSVKKRL